MFGNWGERLIKITSELAIFISLSPTVEYSKMCSYNQYNTSTGSPSSPKSKVGHRNMNNQAEAYSKRVKTEI